MRFPIKPDYAECPSRLHIQNLAQLYELALKQDLGGYWLLFREAITNYRTAQRYLDHYNYPYDFALISFKLSQLYFQYWKFSNDIQALRDAVYFLREAEKPTRRLLFPNCGLKLRDISVLSVAAGVVFQKQRYFDAGNPQLQKQAAGLPQRALSGNVGENSGKHCQRLL